MIFCSEAKTVVARKAHRCTNCGELINAGGAYVTWTSVDDAWFTNKMHPECHVSLLDDADNGHFEYTLYGGERPEVEA